MTELDKSMTELPDGSKKRGRKVSPGGKLVRITITLTEEQLSWLEWNKRDNKSAWIRSAIDAAIASTPNTDIPF